MMLRMLRWRSFGLDDDVEMSGAVGEGSTRGTVR